MNKSVAAGLVIVAIIAATTPGVGRAAEPRTDGGGSAAPANGARPSTQPAGADQTIREMAFAAMLTDAQLVGSYTRGDDATPHQDQYTILKAEKRQGNLWAITAKIGYRGQSFPVTLALPVEWAGDTPVITLSDFAIPGFGTFTARVMFFKDQYAGMWQHGKVGGQMWGRIEHGPVPATGPAAAATKPATPGK